MAEEQPQNIKTRKKVNIKKIVIRTAIILVLVALVAVPILSQRNKSLLSVNTTVVKRGDVEEFLSLEARLVPKEIQKVMASGQKVVRVYVEEGDEVRRGQLLMTLDMSELERTVEERKKALEEQEKLNRDIESLMASLKRAGSSLNFGQVSKLTGNANELLTKLNDLIADYQTDELPAPDSALIQNSLDRVKGIFSNDDELTGQATKLIGDIEKEIERLQESSPGLPDDTLRLLELLQEQLLWMRSMLEGNETVLGTANDLLGPWANDLTDPSLTQSLTDLSAQLETRLSETEQLLSQIDQLSNDIDALINEIENATTLPIPTTGETEETNTEDTTPEKPPSTSNSGVTFGMPRLQAGGIDSMLLSQGSGVDILSLLTSGMGQYGQLMGLVDNSLEAAEKALAEAEPEIRADFDGTIVHLNVKRGDQPSPLTTQTPLMEVYKRGEFEAVFQANENDAHRLSKGDKVSYVFSGMEFHGKIIYKAPVAESASDAFGQSSFDLSGILGGVGGMSPTVTVRMSVEGDDLDKLTPGFNIRADVEIGRKTDVLTVPVESLIRDRGRDCVLRLENDVASIVPVTLGLQGATTVEIVAGLEVGDIIAVNPNPDIKDGNRVAAKTHTP
ncbi:MAG TPA: biotin/lipoyl-binding protein [Clostridiaceae bacterium]|nr:biotin/lipoyl-binding protein [Clostridiaceae bacterium]